MIKSLYFGAVADCDDSRLTCQPSRRDLFHSQVLLALFSHSERSNVYEQFLKYNCNRAVEWASCTVSSGLQELK